MQDLGSKPCILCLTPVTVSSQAVGVRAALDVHSSARGRRVDSGRQRRTRFSSRGGRVRDVAACLLFPTCLSPCVFLQVACAVPSGVRLSVCRRHTWVGERGG